MTEIAWRRFPFFVSYIDYPHNSKRFLVPLSRPRLFLTARKRFATTRFAPPPSTPDTRLEPAERRRRSCGRRRPHTVSSAVETASRAAARCATTVVARLVAMDASDPLCAAILNARYSIRAGGATAAELRPLASPTSHGVERRRDGPESRRQVCHDRRREARGDGCVRFSRQRDLIPLSTTIPAAAARPPPAPRAPAHTRLTGGGGGRGEGLFERRCRCGVARCASGAPDAALGARKPRRLKESS